MSVGRDGSGGVPVDGDPVGMMLDVSDTGGATVAAATAARPELVTNGTFDTDSDWTKGAGWTISGGVATSTPPGTGNPELFQSIGMVAGTAYEVSLTVTRVSGTLHVRLGSGVQVLSISQSGTYRAVGVAGAPWFVLLNVNGSFEGTVDNISVKEISSHAAIAPSDSARPTLASYNSPISSREVLTTTYGWNITDGGRA